MQRKRYSSSHWARLEATEEALRQYLACYPQTYNRTKVMLFEALLGHELEGKRVLDYGGGGGFMSVLCAEKGAGVTLVDAEASALRTARLHAARRGVGERVETVCAESFPSELTGRQFDVVLAKDVLEHVPDDQALLRQLSLCQPQGGRLVLSTQNRRSLNYLLEGSYRRWWCREKTWCGWDPTHLRFYTPASLTRLLKRSGYVPRRWRGLFIIPYNILSWFSLLRSEITVDGLHKFDLWFGGIFPFNRWGWNLVVLAERMGDGAEPSGSVS